MFSEWLRKYLKKSAKLYGTGVIYSVYGLPKRWAIRNGELVNLGTNTHQMR